MAGYGDRAGLRGASRRWAADVLAEHRVLRELPAASLREISLLDEGTTLVRLHEYLDLHDPARASFRAEGGEVVKPGQRMVAHEDVPDGAWSDVCAACERVRQRTALRRAG